MKNIIYFVHKLLLSIILSTRPSHLDNNLILTYPSKWKNKEQTYASINGNYKLHIHFSYQTKPVLIVLVLIIGNKNKQQTKNHKATSFPKIDTTNVINPAQSLYLGLTMHLMLLLCPKLL